MHIIPVVDIKNGIPVHAIAGKRDDYGPIQNSRFDCSSVFTLCKKIIAELSPKFFYIADLDAIEHGRPNISLLSDLLRLPTHWLMDVGLKTAADLYSLESQFSRSENWSAIFGSESLSSLKELELAVSKFDSSRIVFSCDLRNGQLMGTPALAELRLDSLIAEVAILGVKQFIMIDLADVGTNRVSLPSIIGKLQFDLHSIELFAGGGIKDENDLRQFDSIDCRGVLVATAIHKGAIIGEHAHKD